MASLSIKSKNRDRLVAVLMLLPSLFLLAIFVYGFIGQTAWNSLTDWAGVAQNAVINFVGFDNYNKLFTGLLEVRFRQSLVNTFFFTMFFMLACLGVGLFLAVLLDQRVRGEGVFRMMFLFPMALSFIVTGIRWMTDRTQIWQFNWQDLPKIFAIVTILVLAYVTWRYWRNHHKRGMYISGITGLVILVWVLLGGADAIVILEYEETHGFNLALISLVIAAGWQMSGYTMAMYLAGMRGIPEDLREAALVDGASEFQVYRRIILPMLQPITLSAMIVLGHISLKIFDLIFVMAGPDNATTDVPGILMFTTAFRANQFAKGAAIAVVMLLMVAVVIVPYLVSTLRSELEL